MNLNDGSYRPYHKPNDEIRYIHSESNHPPAIIKQLPLSIESRLRKISSTKEIFDDSCKIYQDALKQSGFKYELTYEETENETELVRRNRRRNIIWFNPPYSKSVATNVGKTFLKLLEKHFPAHHKFRKIFNRNTFKISYLCLPNVKAKVNMHNKTILRPTNVEQSVDSEPIRMCNCPRTAECPFEDVCLDKDVRYTAELSSDLPNYGTKEYTGICSTEWKSRLGNHKKSFENERYETDSELSKEVWRIKRKGGNFSIKWRKDGNYSSYKPETKRCSLCANEKLAIARYEGNNLLNRRNEIISRCRHRLRYKLEKLVF